MTVVAIWCRHLKDNVIGIGHQIPWNAPRDVQNFLDIVAKGKVVCGRKTYESLPDDALNSCFIYMMTRQTDYVVKDMNKHKVISSQRDFADLEEDEVLYVIGGAEIYKLFMNGKEKLKPHIIVDCVYTEALNSICGSLVDISSCVQNMEKSYFRISSYYKVDDVVSAVWVRKGEFVAQSELRKIIQILSKDAEVLETFVCV